MNFTESLAGAAARGADYSRGDRVQGAGLRPRAQPPTPLAAGRL